MKGNFPASFIFRTIVANGNLMNKEFIDIRR